MSISNSSSVSSAWCSSWRGFPISPSRKRSIPYYLKLQEASDTNLRMLGFLAMFIGLLLVYFGTS